VTILYADLETFSDVPINHGTHAYAERAEVMLFPYAIDDGPAQCWDVANNPMTPTDLLVAINSSNVIQVWHNGGNFDRTVLHHAMPNFEPPIERMHDTMVMALAHGLPGALGQLGDILGIEDDAKKHKRGRELINLFCKPRPATSKIRRATRATHPAEWQEFIDYAKADITAMRAIYKKLPQWNYRNGELALWQLDQRINNRGVAVDLDLASAAIRATERAQRSLAAQTQDLTNNEVQAATQRDKMLAHILGEYGVDLPDMQISTLERRIDDPDLPAPLRDLLAIRLQASKTSASKYKRVLEGANADGRLRGLLQFCGASRTGRWAGRLFQPQNLPRPTHKQKIIDQGIAAMKADTEDLIFPDVMALASSAIRGVIVAPPGKKLVVADLSNIEGRVLAWLAGEEWKLQAFRDFDAGTGADLYALAYAKSFGITADEVMENKKSGDGSMRQIGKVQELALGYEGGVGAFITFSLAYGIDLEAMAEAAVSSINDDTKREALGAWEWAEKKNRTFGLSKRAYVVCDSFKRLWREAHPHVASFWKVLEDSARRAILSPGVTVPCRKLKLRRDGAWLRIALPSGRALCYPSPAVDEHGKVSYMGINQYSRKWQRLKTYGGKLAENVTQAASRDVLASSMQPIEDAGYEIVLTVHDEIISEAPDTDAFNSDHLASLMATVPSWAEGLPLAAAGFHAYRYRKD
jgi:DNA polymerase